MLKKYECPETEVVILTLNTILQEGNTDSHGFQDPGNVGANEGFFEEDADDVSFGGKTDMWNQ